MRKRILTLLSICLVNAIFTPSVYADSNEISNFHTIQSSTKFVERYIPFDNNRPEPKSIWVQEGNYSGYIYFRGYHVKNGQYYSYYWGYLRRGPYVENRVVDNQ